MPSSDQEDLSQYHIGFFLYFFTLDIQTDSTYYMCTVHTISSLLDLAANKINSSGLEPTLFIHFLQLNNPIAKCCKKVNITFKQNRGPFCLVRKNNCIMQQYKDCLGFLKEI